MYAIKKDSIIPAAYHSPKAYGIESCSNREQYNCTLCKSQMTSEVAWAVHVNGKRHLKKLDAVKIGTQRRTNACSASNSSHPERKSGILNAQHHEVAQIQFLFDEIMDEPLIGLDFVEEVCHDNDINVEPLYSCTLCKLSNVVRNEILSHVISHDHRLQYLKLKDIEKYYQFATANCNSKSKQQQAGLIDKLRNEIVELESIFGKGIAKISIILDCEKSYVQNNQPIEQMKSENEYQPKSAKNNKCGKQEKQRTFKCKLFGKNDDLDNSKNRETNQKVLSSNNWDSEDLSEDESTLKDKSFITPNEHSKKNREDYKSSAKCKQKLSYKTKQKMSKIPKYKTKKNDMNKGKLLKKVKRMDSKKQFKILKSANVLPKCNKIDEDFLRRLLLLKDAYLCNLLESISDKDINELCQNCMEGDENFASNKALSLLKPMFDKILK